MAWIWSSITCWIWIIKEFYSFGVIIVWSYQTLLEVLSTTWFEIFFGIGVILDDAKNRQWATQSSRALDRTYKIEIKKTLQKVLV